MKMTRNEKAENLSCPPPVGGGVALRRITPIIVDVLRRGCEGTPLPAFSRCFGSGLYRVRARYTGTFCRGKSSLLFVAVRAALGG